MTLQYVPLIDLEPFRSDGAAGRRAVARQVAEACVDIGFLVVVNHGVDEALCDRMLDVSRKFFALERGDKLRCACGDHKARGYSGPEDESLSYVQGEEAPGDLKESLTIGPLDGPGEGSGPDAGWFFAENVWPQQPQELRETWSAYYRALTAFSEDMLRIFEAALALEDGYFRRFTSRPTSSLRVLNYPVQTSEPKPGQLRAGMHTDYDTFTLLRHGGKAHGLQVLNRNRQWTDVPVIERSFVVNIGDALAQWTNDRWVSTLHRVVNPPRGDTGERLSVVFFHQPNHDAVIECLPGCSSSEEPARYRPVSYGEYLQMKLRSQTTFTVAESVRVAPG